MCYVIYTYRWKLQYTKYTGHVQVAHERPYRHVLEGVQTSYNKY